MLYIPKPIVVYCRLALGMLICGGFVQVQAATLTVNNVADSGSGSLRQALAIANVIPGPDIIRFDIGGAGVRSIVLFSPLPNIIEPVTIDGTTQPGYAGQPLIELNGTAAGTDTDGLLIFADSCVVRGLIINRFTRDGIHIQNGLGTVVEGNYIGTDFTGKVAFGNGDAGVTIAESFGNTIGGSDPAKRNVLSGNRAGVVIFGASSAANHVEGNFIGVDVTGTNALANADGGVVVLRAFANVIGGTAPGAGNVIAANGAHGVFLQGPDAGQNVVQGNLIGTDVTGRLDLGNAANGVMIDGAGNTTVGGEQPGARNVISANKNRGVVIRGAGADAAKVQGNFIGTDVTGTNRLGNMFTGLAISSIPDNLIGGTSVAARNVIAGNGQSGITIEGGLASNNTVQGNFIGVDATGRRGMSNGFSGVIVAGAALCLIGGDEPGAGNVISANGQNGVHLVDIRATRNVVQGNRIGTDVNGTLALGNMLAGVRIETSSNVIGGNTPQARNIISGNTQSGVFILNTMSNVVSGNFIGTDAAGAVSLRNHIGGVAISASSRNRIGGVNWGEGNIISGNSNSGVYVIGSGATMNLIQGNRIGCDVTGNVAIGNVNGGVYLYGVSGTVIGGSEFGAGNQISGNRWGGISVGDPGAAGTIIQGNFLGTKANGTSALGNQWHNIEILNQAQNTVIGGVTPGAGNRIGFCQSALFDGVRVRDGCNGNTIRGNAMFSNNGLAIDLGVDGPATNDNCDGDNGGNGLQNYPVITAASGQYFTTIQGTLNSKANASYTIDFYSNGSPDSTGYGEGLVWLGATVVQTSGCTASFNVKLTNACPAGPYVTATATDAAGNTSEFGLNTALVNGPDFDLDGMPDDYETAFGLNPTINDRDADLDGDGISNGDEMLAGTDPSDALSHLQLALGLLDPEQVLLSFPSVYAKSYALECVGELPGIWNALAAGLAGTGGPILVTDPIAPGGKYYRVRVE